MITLVTAIYENGVLRPLTPLELPEHTQVQLSVLPLPTPDDAQEHRRRVQEVLVAAGLRRPTTYMSTTDAEESTSDGERQTPPRLPGTPVSDIVIAQRRGELARRFSADRPLSELITEEREGR